MSGIGKFKMSDALGKGGASKAAKGKAKEKGGAKANAADASFRGHIAEGGRGTPPTGHQKVVGSGRGG